MVSGLTVGRMARSDDPPAYLDDCIDYVRDRHPDGDPLERLAEATAVAEYLTALADKLVGIFVGEARAAGLSWTTIGHSLGVTKQAAQRRFVGSAPGALPPQQVEPPAWIGPGVSALVQQSQQEARQYGHAYIDIEHMLLAALHDRRGLAYQAIRGVGAEPSALRAAILAVTPPRHPPTQGDPMFTPRAKYALDARRIARRHGHDQVGPQHILLNILGSRKSGPLLKALKQAGLNESAVRTWLEHHDR